MVLSCFRCRDSDSKGAKFQDERYGKGLRVHNACAKSGAGPRNYRCTVCGQERTSGSK
jgi:hypothetical protein